MSEYTASQWRRRERVRREVRETLCREMREDPYPDIRIGKLPDDEKRYVLTIILTVKALLRYAKPLGGHRIEHWSRKEWSLGVSPFDYQMAREWCSKGYDLAVVLDTIYSLFEAREKRPEWTGSMPLRYCWHAVEEAVEAVRKLRHGRELERMSGW